MTNKKAIALLRVSGAGQAAADKEGLPVQREDCLALAQAHRLEIVEWVQLEGVSGAAVLQDPRFNALLSRLESPEIHGVVVGAFDRLFRRGRFGDYAILDAFADTGTQLYTPQGSYDLRTDSDALLGVIHSELSAAERRNIARRTRAGRERRRREKGWKAEGNGSTVGVPRGVQFDQVTKQWGYAFPEAELVREVFRLFLSGETNFSAIARAVGLAQRLASSGGTSWAIRSILQQPLYMGIYRVNRRWLGGGRWEPRPPEECYEHKVLDPSLISPEDWNQAQLRLADIRGAKPHIPPAGERPLDYLGHLDCVGCGMPLSSRRDTRTKTHPWSYICSRSYHRSAPNRCTAFCQLKGPTVDEYVSQMLERTLGDQEVLAQLVEEVLRDESTTAGSRPEETDRRISELGIKRHRIIDAYEDGTIELPDLRKRIAAIDTERSVLEGLQAPPSATELDADAIRDLVDVFSSWSILRRPERQKLLGAFRIRISLSRTGTHKHHLPKVESITLGALGSLRMNLSTYKKMKRLRID